MTSSRARRRGWLIRAIAMAPILGFLVACAVSQELRGILQDGWDALRMGDGEALEAWARARGAWAPVATSVLMVIQALAAPIPAVLVTWTNALLFGWVWGGILSILSANLAAALCYAIGRGFGEPVVRVLVRDAAWERSERFLRRHGTSTVLVARLVPIVPFDPISYLAGVSGMRFAPFFWATLIGQIPAGMAYSWLGSQITEPQRFFLAGGSIFAALLVLGFAVRARLRRGMEDGEDGDGVAEESVTE